MNNVIQFLSELQAEDQSIDSILQKGAQQLIQNAIIKELEVFLADHSSLLTEDGKKAIVRNGYLPERSILTKVGSIPVTIPKVRDRNGTGIKFNSTIVPPYLKRSDSITAFVPWLYLKGISTGDMSEALHSFLGDQAKSLTPDLVSKLKQQWLVEYKDWCARQFNDRKYVYIWADGIYSNVRIDNRLCLLVVLGVTTDGKKELIAIHDGERESEQSWRELLEDLKHRGLQAPNLAVGDGAMGFWSALTKVYPQTRQQRCWFHKMGNVLNKAPKAIQPAVKSALQQIWMAKTKEDALKAFDKFEKVYGEKYPKALQCLAKDKDELLTFYDFPALHWQHIRTTNPIESTFATIRLRTHRTKNCGSRDTTLMMVFKLAQTAQGRYHKLKGFCLLNDVAEGVQFKDGEKIAA
ncbi:unnamed protein product [Rotaria magnacalcarata]|uniref:Mutator family transposase n=1 Tax=Rotaria magnacalcarata TaxID=392030 RepID=A0A816T8P0_9BILA|nr:unnamed protein product [Rotaria magnacalcarata]CAF3952837.1 unnamed protein product [Rotaria magnacalcarata]